MIRYVSKTGAIRLGVRETDLPASPARSITTADNHERKFYLLDELQPTRSANVAVYTEEQIDELAACEQQERLRLAAAEEDRRIAHERWMAEAPAREAEYRREVALRRKQTTAQRRTQTDSGCPYRSLRAAYDDGWVELDEQEDYGGGRMLLKGHRLIRKGKRAVSETEWKRRGFKVKPGERPHGLLCCYAWYAVYRDDQVAPITPAVRPRRRAGRKEVPKVAPKLSWQKFGF